MYIQKAITQENAMTTTQLAPIANAIELELQDLRENHEYEKNQCQAAIAKGDFVRASRSMHECMIWQYNQSFCDSFTSTFDLDVNLFDSSYIANRIGSLMANILCTVSNPRAADLALQDAQKEQYKFLVKVQKMIARREAA
jgi:hypothetical protein